MSAAARFFLVLIAACTISLVNTLPPTGHQKGKSRGNNWNIPRSQPFHPSHSSEQHEIPQARRDVPTLEYFNHSINNQTDIHTERVNPSSQGTANINFQLADIGPLPNPTPQRVVDHYVHLHSTENFSTHSNNQQIPMNSPSSSRINNHDSSVTVQNNEQHVASRGNRRVITDNAAQRTQALSNLNEDLAKPNRNRFESNFPEVNTSENIHESGATRIRNRSEIIKVQSRNEPLQMASGSDYLRNTFSAVNNSHNRSNTNGNKLATPSGHERIVTSTNKNEGHHPNMSAGLKQWEGMATPASILSSSDLGGGRNLSKSGGEAIVFPDAKLRSQDDAPACAGGKTYCTEVDDYPLSQLDNVLNDSYSGYFGVEPALDDPTVKNRIGDEGDSMCRSESKVIFPKMAQNKDDKWMFIINLNDKQYIQGINVELCSNLDGTCQLSEGFPPGYTTTCRQKFIYRRLLALNDDGKPIPDSFKLPACCTCYFSKTPIGNRIFPTITEKSQG